jgi:excisionase family DNA binding protein
MTSQGQEKASRRELVTVDEAATLLAMSERTIRRMIRDGRLHVVRDGQRGVWVDVKDIEQKQNGKVRSAFEEVRDRMQQQLDEQAKRIRELQEEVHRHAVMIQGCEKVIHTLEEGIHRLVTLSTVGEGDESHHVLVPDMTPFVALLKTREQGYTGRSLMPAPSPLEKRHLPVGTLRLVQFAAQHNVTVDDIKALFAQGHIQLTVVTRGEYARRNKQEWWIRPEQQRDLIRYWDEQAITYTPCSQCPHEQEDERVHAG